MKVLLTGANGFLGKNLQLQLSERADVHVAHFTRENVLADLPGDYLNWFAREGFPSGELGRLIALMHEIDHNGLQDLLTPLRQLARRDKSRE